MRVVFFYPSKVLGGAEILFVRMAESLFKNGIDVLILDHADGIYRSLTSSEITIEVVSIIRKFACRGLDIIIMPPVNLKSIRRYVMPTLETKILFWNIHPYNSFKILPYLLTDYQYRRLSWVKLVNRGLFARHFLLSKKIFAHSAKHNGIVFMDMENKVTVEQFYNLNFGEHVFLPIPINSSHFSANTNHKFNIDVVCITWIGRISDFKVNTLLFILKELNKINSIRVEFSIIGRGKYTERIQSYISKLSSNIKVKMLGQLSPSALQKHLISNTGLVFAMGTSALESAIFGMPTCLVDAFYGSVPGNYKFKWLFQSYGNNLGRILDNKKLSGDGYVMNNLIEQFQTNAPNIGKRCRDYAIDHHSLDNVTRKFIKYLKNCSNRVIDLPLP